MTETQEEQPLRLLGYNRVSTKEQEIVGFNLDEYDEKIRAQCAARGWNLVQMYREARSAKTEEGRPEYLKMIERFKTDPDVDGIIVYKLDRFHRNLRNALRFFEDLQESGKKFISVMDNIDTTTAMGRAMLQITLVFAELESAQTSERVLIGQKASRDAGFHQTSISLPFWYADRDDVRAAEHDGKAIIKPTKLMVEMALDRDENRLSGWKLQQKYGFSKSSIRANLAKYARWKQDDIHGFIQSSHSTASPRILKAALSKEQKEIRDRAAEIIAEDEQHYQETGKYLYSSLKALAVKCGVHFTTLYAWRDQKLVDLRYRTG